MGRAFVLDTDIGTDVDDALALAYAVRHPDLDLQAVTTCSGDTRLRAAIAATLLRLAGRDDIEVAAGIGGNEARAWMGHEGEGLAVDDSGVSDRDAVSLLLDAHPLDVATVGMQSNVAAVLARGGTVDRLTVMGGVFAPVRIGDRTLPARGDHNLNCDPPAAVRALNAGIPTLYVPFDVTVSVHLRAIHLDRLRAGDDLCRSLASLIDVWTGVLRGRAHSSIPDDVVAVLHDPLTVACLVDRRFVTTEVLPVTVAVHEGAVRTFADPVGGRDAEVVRSVDAAAFVEHWVDVVTRPTSFPTL